MEADMPLFPFEFLCLRTLDVGEPLSGTIIHRQLENKMKTAVNVGSMYVALDELVVRGLATCEPTAPDSKHRFAITQAGKIELEHEKVRYKKTQA